MILLSEKTVGHWIIQNSVASLKEKFEIGIEQIILSMECKVRGII